MPYLLAIDLGTGSCRAVIFATDGRQVGTTRPFPGVIEFPTAAGERYLLLAPR